MNVRRVILISGATIFGLMALTVITSVLAPGLVYGFMEGNSDRKRLAQCQGIEIAKVISEHYRARQILPSREQIATLLVEKQTSRQCGQDPFTAETALRDPWGDELCLVQRSPSSMLVFSKNNVIGGRISAAVVNDGTNTSEYVASGWRCQ